MADDQTDRVTGPALRHVSLPDSAAQLLRRRILNNELPAGTRLVEANLAQEMGVSRATVRQALRQLDAEGLVEISPRRHSVVTRMSDDEVQDVCYARYVLEEGALRSVLAHGIDDVAGPLEQIIARMRAAARRSDLAELVELDTQFHGEIVRAAGKARLASLWTLLDAQMGALMRSSLEAQHLELSTMPQRHQDLLDALRTADPADAASALYGHYLRPGYEL